MIRSAGRTGIFDLYDRVASCMKVYRFIGVGSEREGEIDRYPVCLRRSWLIFIDVNGNRGRAISRDSRGLRENNKDVYSFHEFVYHPLHVPSRSLMKYNWQFRFVRNGNTFFFFFSFGGTIFPPKWNEEFWRLYSEDRWFLKLRYRFFILCLWIRFCWH